MENVLKAIQEMPLNAAYWMGRRDAYAAMIKESMESYTTGGLAKCESELKSLYWWFDLANDNFAHEMGWI